MVLSSLPRKSGRGSSPSAPHDSQSLLTGCRIKLLPSRLGPLLKRLQHFCHFGQPFQTSLSHLSYPVLSAIPFPFLLLSILYKNHGVSSRKKVKVGESRHEGSNFGVAGVWCCLGKNQWREAGEGGQQGRDKKFLSVVGGRIAEGWESEGSGRSPSDCVYPEEEVHAAPDPQLSLLMVPVRGLVGVCCTLTFWLACLHLPGLWEGIMCA